MTLKIRISDLMDYLQDDSVSLREQDVVSAETVQAAVSAKLREQSHPRRSGRTLRILLVAAVLTVLLSFGALAEEQYLGIQSRPEYKAAMEFFRYEQEMMDENREVRREPTYSSGLYTFGIRYQDNYEYMLELAEKYGLEPIEDATAVHTMRQLCQELGVEQVLPDYQYIRDCHGYQSDTGSFTMYGSAKIEDFVLSYRLETVAKGAFAPMDHMAFFFHYLELYPEEYTIEEYLSADGTKVLTCTIGHMCRGYILADLDNSLLCVNLSMLNEVVGAAEDCVPEEQWMDVVKVFADETDFRTLDKLGE